MRKLFLLSLLAGGAGLAGCATVPAEPVTAANTACGTYGYIDVDNDGFITGSEWNTYRSNGYGFWDVDKDGRISRSEFENCWRGGGFYREAYYKPTTGPITGQRSTLTTTAICRTTNTGRPQPGRGSTGTPTAGSIKTSGSGGPSYASQDTPQWSPSTYARFLPHDKAALAAEILDIAWL